MVSYPENAYRMMLILQTKRDAYKYIWDATANQWTRTRSALAN